MISYLPVYVIILISSMFFSFQLSRWDDPYINGSSPIVINLMLLLPYIITNTKLL
jgi:hypothetical protein